MRHARSLLISLHHRCAYATLLAVLIATAAIPTVAPASTHKTVITRLVARAVDAGRCREEGTLVVCHLEAFLRDGKSVSKPAHEAVPYDAIYLSVWMFRAPGTVVVEEVIAHRERWRRDSVEAHVTVLEQLLVPIGGSRQGNAEARILRFNGLRFLTEEPATPGDDDVQDLLNLVIRLFLSTEV